MATISKMGSEGENEGERVLLWREINDNDTVCLGPEAMPIIYCMEMLKKQTNTVLIKKHIGKDNKKCDHGFSNLSS